MDNPGFDFGLRAIAAFAEVWQASASLSLTLTGALAQAGQTTDPTVEATFRAMTDPRSWLQNLGGMDAALGRVTEGAQLADLWNAERQQARLLRAWLDVRQRTLEHHAVVLDAWLRIGGQFVAELPAHLRTAAGAAPDGRALLALWTQTANRVLLETQRSPPFLRTQAAMVRAGTALRLAQTELIERWAEPFNLPTRTELDDVHRTLTELRREVRAMQRAAAGRTMAAVNQET